MKTLYLVRHAKSSWDYPELGDIERPLNSRGERDAPEMGNRLKAMRILPDLMLSSPANRALSTCNIISKTISYPYEKITINKKLYHAGENELLHIIRDINDDVDSLMIFGHNPGLTSFADDLTTTQVDNIPTCGIFACTFDIDTWQDVNYGNGTLLFYDYPKKDFSLL